MQVSLECALLPIFGAFLLMFGIHKARRNEIGTLEPLNVSNDRQTVIDQQGARHRRWSEALPHPWSVAPMSLATESPTTELPSSTPSMQESFHPAAWSSFAPSSAWLQASEWLQIVETSMQKLTESQYKEMQEEKSCPYYTKFGYRGCNLGCSCRSLDQCYPKHAILDYGQPPNQHVDVGTCWPATPILIGITLAVFFGTLGCVIGIRKCALDYTFHELEKVHSQMADADAAATKGFASGTVRVSEQRFHSQ